MASILKCKSALPNIHLPFLYLIYNCCARGKSIQSTICEILKNVNEPHGHKNGQNTADFQHRTTKTPHTLSITIFFRTLLIKHMGGTNKPICVPQFFTNASTPAQPDSKILNKIALFCTVIGSKSVYINFTNCFLNKVKNIPRPSPVIIILTTGYITCTLN